MNTVSTARTFSADQSQVMENFGRAKLADYFGDFVVYRNLEPLDKRLRGFKSGAYSLGIAHDRIPRKQDVDYAKTALWFAEQAQKKLRSKAPSLNELLFVGDSLYNDGQAYANMRRLSGWQSACFIGSEKPDEELVVDVDDDDNVFCANRWMALADWMNWTIEQGMQIDERTVAIVDIDKTALGAKGRNDHVIDTARLEGLYRTMNDVLGDNFNRSVFEQQYDELNRSRYHILTEDNQDYLAYICVVVNAGLIDFEEVTSEVQNGSLDNFEQFLRWVDIRLLGRSIGGESLRQVHEAVIGSVRVGDPTPFKQFRRQEFITTVEHMGNVDDSSLVDEILEYEITLTNEVCELAEWLQSRDVLLLCMSDKPYEASCPDPHASPDLLPVHKTETHRVGAPIRSFLNTL